jgi:hypothetical protein
MVIQSEMTQFNKETETEKHTIRIIEFDRQNQIQITVRIIDTDYSRIRPESKFYSEPHNPRIRFSHTDRHTICSEIRIKVQFRINRSSQQFSPGPEFTQSYKNYCPCEVMNCTKRLLPR